MIEKIKEKWNIEWTMAVGFLLLASVEGVINEAPKADYQTHIILAFMFMLGGQIVNKLDEIKERR